MAVPTRGRALVLAVILATPALAWSSPASAQGSGGDAAAAEALYNEGAAEMEAGRFATACPKLEESFRLDPATGALLTLAACFERSGKVASAWVRYLDVEARAAKEGDKDRASVARQKAAELVPRLPRIRILLGPAVSAIPGLEVRRDQTALNAATLSTALPVDPGVHVVEVSAPGHATARREVTAVEARSDDVRFDALEKAAAPSSSGGDTAPPQETDPGGLTSVQIGGLVVGGAGLVALGVGFGFGAVASGASSDLEALDGYDPATGECPGASLSKCNEKFDSASSAATASTILVIGGSVLAATGLVMVLVGGSGSADDARVELAPAVGGATLRGSL